MSTTPELERVRELVVPIASDLQLDLYDVERRGGTVRVTLDTPPGSDGGVTLDDLALATRLISRELDHADPIAGRYTLEVTSPGLERPLRTPAHFRREVGKDISVRLRDAVDGMRRIDGVLVAADDDGFVVRVIDEAGDGEPVEHRIEHTRVDKARTVFTWESNPKPGKQPGTRPGTHSRRTSGTASSAAASQESSKEKQSS